MNSNQTPSLPNAADAMKLKALIPELVNACPDMYSMAREAAQEILDKHGIHNIEPETVYWHRFNNTTASNPKAFTGWEHFGIPHQSLTLPQLVIKRFDVHDQDNADLLDVYGGFYHVGPDAGTYNETNEIRLHGNEVLNDLWAINFKVRYNDKLASFWKNHAGHFRALAKCSFIAKAMEDRESGRLSDDNFRTVIKAVAGNVSWPVTFDMLQADAPAIDGLRICKLEIGEFFATDILRIIDRNGRQIIYVPGETWGFHAFETPRDLHWWLLSLAKDTAGRQRLMSHFQLADHEITQDNVNTDFWLSVLEGVSPLGLATLLPIRKERPDHEQVGLNAMLDLLFSTWQHDNHHLINSTDEKITTDAFTFLSQATQVRMISDANYLMHSNGELRKKLWIGYLNAFNRLFGPLAAVGWPVALVVVGAGIANVGLKIEQAVNANTLAERKAAVIGAIFTAVDTLFNATFLKGSGALPEIAEANEFIAPEEKLAEAAIPQASLPTLEELTPGRVYPLEQLDSLTPFKTEITEPTRLDFEEKKYFGILQTPKGKNYILMRHDGSSSHFEVRYVAQMNSWVIIDPANPYSFYRNVPVRLNAAYNEWEPITGTGLKGGGRIFGKMPWGQASGTLPDAKLPPTAYDVPAALREELKEAANGRVLDRHLSDNSANLTTSEDALSTFKSLRKSLYEDASAYFAHPDLPARVEIPLFNPATKAKDIIKRIFENSRALVIGENHSAVGSKQFLIENMELLAKQKIKTLYMEHLLTDFHQVDLNTFARSGKMPEDLERYLKELDKGHHTDPSGRYTFLEVVKSAQKNHIRIQAIDCMSSYRVTGLQEASQNSRQLMMNYFSRLIINADQAARGSHNWVALVGESHANNFDGVPGLSELEGGIGLRIEDVAPGQSSGIEVDPGRFATNELKQVRVHNDLRLQIEVAEPVAPSLPLETRLPKRGMFALEHTSGKPFLVHRSNDGSIVRTAIKSDRGHIYIERANWSVSGQRFSSLAEFVSALEHMGMKFVR
ncbi:membrane-targeted effector domain-containing toxin [Pseudomonas fluorescens]|uniref:Dermonecrotic toxin N-terminal domain-containing protein n=1 Tax=Pseudomonas fluorescens TaxID=294 RepID=A0A5E7A2D9_PSEFL|nr:membrane-targeted effector domain-containing toxin [Pseudomonas fluorescens]VVN70107.1 hypothetical protein PS723_00344 [Pseudomonas fluorescens]